MTFHISDVSLAKADVHFFVELNLSDELYINNICFNKIHLLLEYICYFFVLKTTC